MTRLPLCLLLFVGIIAFTEAGIDRRPGFGQASAQAEASSISGGGRPGPPPPAFGGRGFGNNGYGGNRGLTNGIHGNRGSSGTSISIAKSVTINRGGASNSQSSASALSRGK